ncbi:MAG: NERD domain-containing protein [Hyphomonas sp.]
MRDFLIYGLLAFLLVAAWVLRSPWFKGLLGEVQVNSSLRGQLDQQQYRLIKDLTLPAGDGTTQVDHVILSRFGVFVIETKNMTGWIFGTEKQAQWTQTIYRKKSRFQNPLRQNYKHIKTIQELLGLKNHQLHGIVVFVGSGVPKTQMPASVVWGTRSLVEYIRSKRDVVFDQEDLDGVAERLTGVQLKAGMQTRRTHNRHVKAIAAERQDPAKCPRCGGGLVERTNRKTNEPFLSCSKFPKCRGTRKLA